MYRQKDEDLEVFAWEKSDVFAWFFRWSSEKYYECSNDNSNTDYG